MGSLWAGAGGEVVVQLVAVNETGYILINV